VIEIKKFSNKTNIGDSGTFAAVDFATPILSYSLFLLLFCANWLLACYPLLLLDQLPSGLIPAIEY
jgi:hypothetical protein